MYVIHIELMDGASTISSNIHSFTVAIPVHCLLGRKISEEQLQSSNESINTKTRWTDRTKGDRKQKNKYKKFIGTAVVFVYEGNNFLT